MKLPLCVVVVFLFLCADITPTLASGIFFSKAERENLHQLVRQGKKNEASHIVENRFRQLEKKRHSDKDMFSLEEEEEEDIIDVLNKDKSRTSSKACPCKCDPGRLDFIASAFGGDDGYGRYCGAGYGCKDTSQPGCDRYDDCCRIHDICVTKTGYCDSCKCNVALANCIYRLPRNTTGFRGCKKQLEAREDILDNICLAVEVAPESCGGCPDKLDHPKSCQDNDSGSIIPLFPLLLLLLLSVSLTPFLG